jgi:hypothetical protein
VITDDEVMRLFERADPARVDDDASVIDVAGYLDALRTRSSTVPIIETTPTPIERTSRHRRPIIIAAAAAAAVVLIVVGAVALATRDDTTEPATDQTSVATEVARGFVEAYGAFDADKALSYLADDADISGLIEGGSPEALRPHLAWLEAVGQKQMLDSCNERSSSATDISIRCTYDFHSFGSDELGLGPFRGSYFDLTVRDGAIVQASKYVENEQFSPQMWSPFADWMDANYPADADVMYTSASRSGLPRYTEESIQLWARHIRDYVAAKTAQG